MLLLTNRLQRRLLGLLVTACCGLSACSDPGAQPSAGRPALPTVDVASLTCLKDTDAAEQARLQLDLVQRALNPPERQAHGPIFPATAAVAQLQAFIYPKKGAGAHNGWCHDRFRTLDIRRTGPLVPIASRIDGKVATKGLGTHAQVRVFYSDDVVRWLAAGREGAIPDGAMIVKEMYPGNKVASADDLPDGWAVMIKDSAASRDGWLWYLFYHSGNQAYGAPFESAQYGLSFCVACHASATSEGTFAALDNLLGTNVATYVEIPDAIPPREVSEQKYAATDSRGPHANIPAILAPPEISHSDDEPCKASRICTEKFLFSYYLYNPLSLPKKQPEGALFSLLQRQAENPDAFAGVTKAAPQELPMDAIYDHIPSSPDAENQELWVTASNCSGCHGTSDLVNATMPEMSVPVHNEIFDAIYPKPDQRLPAPVVAALSPYEEWSGSLMSVSSRDPVFRAQLESELQRFPEHAEQTQDLCLSCHAPMGYRSDKDLSGKFSHTYAIPNEQDPLTNQREAGFGALARDGVSCGVCHHMEPENFGEPESFNAQFTLGAPHEIYGPYGAEDNLKTVPMRNAMGITPKQGTHLADSGLCGSCHMVRTPVYRASAQPAAAEKQAHEQTTYMEWRNSDFAADDSRQTCQNCHMQTTNPLALEGADPATRSAIANIEDTNFPYSPNRLDSNLIDLETRVGYPRHTLTGINLFTLAMFAQFPKELGSNTFFPTRAMSEVVSPTAFTMEAAKQMATQETAALSLSATDRHRFDVTITNQAGHKFPTGVGFRRAFIEFSAYDADGEQLWCSGCSTSAGVIVDGDNNPLSVEFPRQSNQFEPHHIEIDSQAAVQIYETRHTNADGLLTTSFLELDKEVKDTRILPQGWSAERYVEFEMNPVGKDIPSPTHMEQTTYVLPDAVVAKATRIQARLLYQALPPYYLIDRTASLGDGETDAQPESARLAHLLSRLDLAAQSSATAIAGWKLEIATSTLSATPGAAAWQPDPSSGLVGASVGQ